LSIHCINRKMLKHCVDKASYVHDVFCIVHSFMNSGGGDTVTAASFHQ